MDVRASSPDTRGLVCAPEVPLGEPGDSALPPLGVSEAPGCLPVLFGQLLLCHLSSNAVEQHRLEKFTVYNLKYEFIYALKKLPFQSNAVLNICVFIALTNDWYLDKLLSI